MMLDVNKHTLFLYLKDEHYNKFVAFDIQNVDSHDIVSAFKKEKHQIEGLLEVRDLKEMYEDCWNDEFPPRKMEGALSILVERVSLYDMLKLQIQLHSLNPLREDVYNSLKKRYDQGGIKKTFIIFEDDSFSCCYLQKKLLFFPDEFKVGKSCKTIKKICELDEFEKLIKTKIATKTIEREYRMGRVERPKIDITPKELQSPDNTKVSKMIWDLLSLFEKYLKFNREIEEYEEKKKYLILGREDKNSFVGELPLDMVREIFKITDIDVLAPKAIDAKNLAQEIVQKDEQFSCLLRKTNCFVDNKFNFLIRSKEVVYLSCSNIAFELGMFKTHTEMILKTEVFGRPSNSLQTITVLLNGILYCVEWCDNKKVRKLMRILGCEEISSFDAQVVLQTFIDTFPLDRFYLMFSPDSYNKMLKYDKIVKYPKYVRLSPNIFMYLNKVW